MRVPSHLLFPYYAISVLMVSVQVFVMVRPRRGDFFYTELELNAMVSDVETFKHAGADGFVFGCLRANGELDIEANQRLIAAAEPLPCTLHRAFDVSRDPIQAAETAASLGFKRILTSGQQRTALLGVDLLKILQEKFGGRVVIMAGVGISEDNAAVIINKTGVIEIHSSASVQRDSKMEFRNLNSTMSVKGSDEFKMVVTNADKVRRIIAAMEFLNKADD